MTIAQGTVHINIGHRVNLDKKDQCPRKIAIFIVANNLVKGILESEVFACQILVELARANLLFHW